MAATLCLTALLGFLFGGCRKKPDDDPGEVPVEGGHTTHVDPDAPKDIQSSDLVEFYASLYLENRCRGDEEREFEFVISPDENGKPVASETITGIRCPADRALTDALAGIIAAHSLAAQNGLYDVTAGLPPEYQAHPFRAVYASGETLTFTVNNDPTAAWAEEVYDTFAAWFSGHGTDALEPALDETPVVSFRLDFTDGSKTVSYGDVNVDEDDAIDGETYLLEREIYKTGFFGRDSRRFRLFPDDYYDRLTAIIAASGLEKKFLFSYYDREACNYGNHDAGYYGWGDKTTADGEEDAEDLWLALNVEYESGNWISIDTQKPSEIEAMRPFLKELMKYLDSLF